MSVLKINTVQPQMEIADHNANKKTVTKPDTSQASPSNQTAQPSLETLDTSNTAHMKQTLDKPEITEKSALAIKPIYVIKLRHLLKRFIPMVAGLLLIYVAWTLASHHVAGFPGTKATWRVATEILNHPFYSKSPTDIGLGWHIVNSLENVLLGFMLAAVAGVPLGFMIGKYQFMSRMIGVIIDLFKPVSPLAWLPIGLLAFKTASFAAIWVVFLSAVWPIMINTAIGVSKAPPSYMNVGKMLNLSEWEIMTKILFPYALPSIMNGLRLAIGIAWLVIVAIEMLKSDSGIGFWILHAWQQADYERILIGVLMIGVIGFLLEFLLKLISKRAFHQYWQAKI